MFRKLASAQILDFKGSSSQVANVSLEKFADFQDYRTDDGFMYVRVRAISSRVNKNHDGWPSDELQKSYRTFIGKPIFVDHHNHDPRRARGVVRDAELHIEDDVKTAALDPYYSAAPTEHLPPTWVELLLEVDAKKFPKLAKAIVDGDIDSVSMGCNVERSKCSHCGNWATKPEEYCKHILSKGAYFDHNDEFGNKISKRSYEDCYDIGFFELSFVFDPADETAHVHNITKAAKAEILKEGAGFLGDQPGWEGEPEEVPASVGGGGGDYGNYPGVEQGSEEEQVIAWRAEQLMKAGMPSEKAWAMAQRHQGPDAIDYHQVVDTMGQGATPDQAERIYSKYEVEDLFTGRLASVYKHSDNPIPQSEMTTAPEEVDTLRQEQICPICGSDMDDGVCEVCNYEEPPEGFDNPDLEKAKEMDKQMHEEDTQQAAEATGAQPPQEQTDIAGGGPQGAPQGAQMAGPQQQATSKTTSSTTVTSEIKVSAAPKGTRINTQERPILPVTRKLSDRPLNTKTVKDSVRPVESNRKDTMEDTTTQKTADGASAQGEGVAPEKRVDVEGVGGFTGDPLSGIEHENVEKDTGDFTAPHTDTWSGDEGDSLGQHEPVSSDPTASDLGGPIGESLASTQKTAEGTDVYTEREPGNGFPTEGLHPTQVDLLAGLKEEVGEPTKTWSENTVNGLEQAAPVTTELNGNDVGGPIGEAIATAEEAKAQVFKAFKVADAEVELGLIEPDARYDRVSELESTDTASLDAQLETLSKVRTAGLKKTAVTQPKGVGRVPSFKQATASFDIAAHSTDSYDTDDVIGW